VSIFVHIQIDFVPKRGLQDIYRLPTMLGYSYSAHENLERRLQSLFISLRDETKVLGQLLFSSQEECAIVEHTLLASLLRCGIALVWDLHVLRDR
jgi:hypothetical protein